MATSEQRYKAILRSAELGRQARTETAQERYERYLELRRRGYTNQVAAWNLGISRRQAERYSVRHAATLREESTAVAA